MATPSRPVDNRRLDTDAAELVTKAKDLHRCPPKNAHIGRRSKVAEDSIQALTIGLFRLTVQKPVRKLTSLRTFLMSRLRWPRPTGHCLGLSHFLSTLQLGDGQPPYCSGADESVRR